MKASNKNWIIEGITYEMPWLFYFIACSMFPAEIMVRYYIWLLLLAAFIALVRSIMVALKLIEVYEKNNVPRVTATTTSGGSTTAENKKGSDSNWSNCCGCLIAIFIIFAIISIL
ncbi:hypothetical protein [Methanobrevibacter sp.]|uniref:hypothetical protein n=1 Tax=Methanobrevibacter sp. TaxID=66852 RepID=UPI00386E6EC7